MPSKSIAVSNRTHKSPKQKDRSQEAVELLNLCVQKYRPESVWPESPRRGLNRSPLVAEEWQLQEWINHLDANIDEEKRAASYLLQIWLNAKGFSLPPGIFKADLTLPRQGRPSNGLGWEAQRLKSDGWSWSKIAAHLLSAVEVTANSRKAADKVRNAAENYRGDDFDSLTEELIDTGYRMLGRPTREERWESYVEHMRDQGIDTTFSPDEVEAENDEGEYEDSEV
jgi:hypothetical protein